MRISDWSSDVFSSDLLPLPARRCCATILAGAAKRMVGLAGTEAQWSRHILTHSLDGRDGRRTRRLPSMPSPAMDSPVSAAAMQTRRIAGFPCRPLLLPDLVCGDALRIGWPCGHRRRRQGSDEHTYVLQSLM